jgi:hypothetical protein
MKRRTLLNGDHTLLAALLARVRGETSDAPDIEDGVRSMQVLEMMMRSERVG